MDIQPAAFILCLVEKNVKHDWFTSTPAVIPGRSGKTTSTCWRRACSRDASQPSITAVGSARAASAGAGPSQGRRRSPNDTLKSTEIAPDAR